MPRFGNIRYRESKYQDIYCSIVYRNHHPAKLDRYQKTMTDFMTTYFNVNLAKYATAYDRSRFLALKDNLERLDPSAPKGLSIGIIV